MGERYAFYFIEEVEVGHFRCAAWAKRSHPRVKLEQIALFRECEEMCEEAFVRLFVGECG